jgi:hypothetical protein
MSVADTSVRTIFIIRHGEKPDTPPPYGVDVDGNQNEHSLLPRGWERAGALATLFAPSGGQFRTGLKTPTQLIAPDYGSAKNDAIHRTHETILPLEQLLGLNVDTPFSEGNEAELGKSVADAQTGITLICWEHKAIHLIANNIPTPSGTKIPQSWPEGRFDVVWSFAFDTSSGTYAFDQIPQLLLAGDSDTPIPP